MNEKFERRKHKRCKARIPVKISHEHSYLDAKSANMSLGGILILTNQPLKVNAKVYTTLNIPKENESGSQEIKIIGNVMRVEEVSLDNGVTAALVAIRFQNVRAEDVEILKAFLSKEYKKNKEEEAKNRVIESEISKAKSEVEEEERIAAEKKKAKVEAEEDIRDEIAVVETPSMNTLESMHMSEAYSEKFSKITKWFFGGGILALLFYVSYYIYLMIRRLSGSG